MSIGERRDVRSLGKSVGRVMPSCARSTASRTSGALPSCRQVIWLSARSEPGDVVVSAALKVTAAEPTVEHLQSWWMYRWDYIPKSKLKKEVRVRLCLEAFCVGGN